MPQMKVLLDRIRSAPTSSKLIGLSWGLLFVTLLAIFFSQRPLEARHRPWRGPHICEDGWYYYHNLRSLALDRDLDLRNEYKRFGNWYGFKETLVSLQFFQSFVQSDNLIRRTARHQIRFGEFNLLPTAAMLVRFFSTCPLDEQATHRLCCSGEEVGASLELGIAVWPQ